MGVGSEYQRQEKTRRKSVGFFTYSMDGGTVLFVQPDGDDPIHGDSASYFLRLNSFFRNRIIFITAK